MGEVEEQEGERERERDSDDTTLNKIFIGTHKFSAPITFTMEETFTPKFVDSKSGEVITFLINFYVGRKG